VQPAFPQQWGGARHPSWPHLGRVSRALGQYFPLLYLTVLLSGCSHGLAPAKPVMWLWQVLIGSNCGRQEKHSFFAPFSLH